MSELVQFVVLQRSEKWVVKSRQLERALGELETKAERRGCGRWYWPAPVAMNLGRFGPSARIPTRWQGPFRAGSPRSSGPRSMGPRSTGPHSTGPAAAPVYDQR